MTGILARSLRHAGGSRLELETSLRRQLGSSLIEMVGQGFDCLRVCPLIVRRDVVCGISNFVGEARDARQDVLGGILPLASDIGEGR